MVKITVCLAVLFLGGAMACPQSSNSTASVGNYFEVDGIKLWYEECGIASAMPGVVLLHDGLVHSATWDGVWAPLCSKYHVVRYDRRGYGRSDPSKRSFIPDDDLFKIMRQTRMDRAILVGNSSGGGLALDFALSHPEMVAGLFLIGPVVHGMATTNYFNERGNQNSAPLSQGDTKAAAQNWSSDRFLIAGDDADVRKQSYQVLVDNPQNLRVDGSLEIRSSPPTALRLSQIRVPTLVVDGEADIPDVFAYSGAIESAVPFASFEVWKSAGHLIQLQKPSELVARFDRYYTLATRKELPLTKAELEPFAGTYSCFNRPDTVSIREGRLVFEVPGDPYYWLSASSTSEFFMRTEQTEISFGKNTSGKVIEMIVHNDDGNVFRCPRL